MGRHDRPDLDGCNLVAATEDAEWVKLAPRAPVKALTVLGKEYWVRQIPANEYALYDQYAVAINAMNEAEGKAGIGEVFDVCLAITAACWVTSEGVRLVPPGADSMASLADGVDPVFIQEMGMSAADFTSDSFSGNTEGNSQASQS